MIIFQNMVPWIYYLLCSIYFTTTVLQDGFADEGHLSDFVFKKLLTSMMVILLVWLITVEYLQIRGNGEGKFCSGLKEHFLDKSNWIDLFQLGSTIWLVFIHYTSMEPHDRLS